MRYLKTYNEAMVDSLALGNKGQKNLFIKYGKETIIKYDGLIQDIYDMLLDLTDDGYVCHVGYTSSTLRFSENRPDIVLQIKLPDVIKIFNNKDVILGIMDRVKEYMMSNGFLYSIDDMTMCGKKCIFEYRIIFYPNQ